jgi:tripartite-type tricarboxylate transporter receptor subunit TctC
VPREIVGRLNAESNRALQRRDFQDWLSSQDMDPMGGSPEDLAARIRNEHEKLSKVILEAGMK